MSLHEQLTEHIKYPKDYDNIFPHPNWTLEEYQELFRYIQAGWLMLCDNSSDFLYGFVINEHWDEEPMWKPE
jgi:hypothetical protein